MKKFILVVSIIFVCSPVFAGIFDAIATIAESSGMEVQLGEIQSILSKIKDQQSEEIGSSADMDVYNKLAEFYKELQVQSAQQLRQFYAAAQEAANEGGDAEYWEHKASDFVEMFKTANNIAGTAVSIADVTEYIKLKGVSKEAKMRYMDDVLEKMRTYYASQNYTFWSDYYARRNIGSIAQIDDEMTLLLGSDENSARTNAEEAANDIERSRNKAHWVVILLVIALAVGTIAISVKKYMSGDQGAQELFIRIAVGVALAAAILLVLSKVHI